MHSDIDIDPNLDGASGVTESRSAAGTRLS